MDKETFAFAQPEWLGEVTSTSDMLKERLAGELAIPSGTVIAARRQVRGRGRMGSTWESSARGDITFSFYWRGDLPPLVAGTLPMACALGVVDFLGRENWRVEGRCKWPNDVLVDGGKICGILTEGGMAAGGGMGLVVGIGLNVRPAPGRDAALGRKTASLEDFVGELGDVEEILPWLLSGIERRISVWEREGFAGIRGDLLKRLWGVGKEIRAKTVRGVVSGVVEGLNEGGELLLRDKDGSVETISSVTAIESGW